MAPLVSFRRLLPPYHKYFVIGLGTVYILFAAVAMSIHQSFWTLSLQIFPIAFDMFDDTKSREPDFAWNRSDRYQLEQYQDRLQLCWLVALAALISAMLPIIPLFCKVEVGEVEQDVFLCVRHPSLARFLAPLLILANLAMAGCLINERLKCQSDDRLFHGLFHDAIKEEVYLTRFEQTLNCVSDEDKEGRGIWKCDGIIERAMLNRQWLDPLLIAQAAIALLSLIGCLFFNRQDLIPKYDEVSTDEEEPNQIARNEVNDPSTSKCSSSNEK